MGRKKRGWVLIALVIMLVGTVACQCSFSCAGPKLVPENYVPPRQEPLITTEGYFKFAKVALIPGGIIVALLNIWGMCYTSENRMWRHIGKPPSLVLGAFVTLYYLGGILIPGLVEWWL